MGVLHPPFTFRIHPPLIHFSMGNMHLVGKICETCELPKHVVYRAYYKLAHNNNLIIDHAYTNIFTPSAQFKNETCNDILCKSFCRTLRSCIVRSDVCKILVFSSSSVVIFGRNGFATKYFIAFL
jgi:hypothetical protein